MQQTAENIGRTVESEDVSLAALSISGASSPVSIYGLGSVPALGLLCMGRTIVNCLGVAVSKHKLAFITRRIRTNYSVAARDPRVCDGLLELSRSRFCCALRSPDY